MKKISSIILALFILVNLAACGGNSAKSEEPNVGTWNAISVSMLGITQEIEEVFEQGVSLELESNGKFNLNMDGEKANGKWKYEDGSLTLNGDGLDLTGTIENGILTLNNMLDTGLDLIFEKEGSNTFASLPKTSGNSETLSELQEWWDGEWYGYWESHSVTDDYKQLEDGRWDCYAVIKMNTDDTGIIYLWDDGEDFATVDITVSENSGAGDMGAAVSEGGNYWNGDEIGHADWIIDPSLYGYENYMVIDGRYVDSYDEGFNYVVYLRPWGQLWNDNPEGERPPWYEDWYLTSYNGPMLEAIREIEGHIHTDLDDITITEKPTPSEQSGGAATENPIPSAPAGSLIETEFVMGDFLVSTTLPAQGWCPQDTPFGYNIYQVETCEDVYSNSPRISINIKPSLIDFDLHFEDFENLQIITNRTISGVDMGGRTYENIGMKWIEYTGLLDSTHAVSVKISKIDISTEEVSAILDSIEFNAK